MLVASINNLIDNSIHWVETRDPKHKFIYVNGLTKDIEEGPTRSLWETMVQTPSKDDPEDVS